jgi:hypothetical protein
MTTMQIPRASRFVQLAYWSGILGAWAVLLALYLTAVVLESRQADVGVGELVGLVGFGLGSAVIWLIGIRHLAMWLVARRTTPQRMTRAAVPAGARVALLYCTADDLNEDALERSLAQDHPVTAVVLDDSSTIAGRAGVDRVALRLGLEVIRRPHRTGFKAGNLNHALTRLLDRFDYFVVLDSDEVVPRHFVRHALSDFASDARIGVVQGSHRAEPGGTVFTEAFAGLLESHVSVVQRARSRMGFSAFMGRGGMISAACLRATGPFPEVVTEDVAYSLEVRRAGYRVHYDDLLVSVEDYPVDYQAFRTQHAKTVEGTTEFVRGAWRRILFSRMGAAEKLDLLVEQLAVPAVGAASLTLFVSGLVFASQDTTVRQPLWAMLATGLFGVAALLPETVRRLRHRGPVVAAAFLSAAVALYASTLVVTLAAIARVVGGRRAVFAITPKRAHGGGALATLRGLRLELGAAVTMLTLALVVSGDLSAALPVLGPVLAAITFALLGARPVRPWVRARLPKRRARGIRSAS